MFGYLERTRNVCPRPIIYRILEFYGPNKHHPDVQELVDEILIPLCKVVKGATFLVDGLDECGRQATLDIMKGFRQLLMSPSCRVFMSCREEVNVLRGIPGSIRIWITAEHTKADMKLFLDKEITERQYDRPISDNQEVLEFVHQELLNKADGM